MGANQSIVLSTLEEIHASILRSDAEGSEELIRKCRVLLSRLPPELKSKIMPTASSGKSDRKNPTNQDIIIPELLACTIEEWIEKPQKFFHISGSQLDLLASKSPTKDVQHYAERLRGQEESVLDMFRERFIKVIMMKLRDIGQMPEKIPDTITNSGKIDVAQYIREGQRLYGLCRDIGKRQENLNHAELGNLFTLPKYATTEL